MCKAARRITLLLESIDERNVALKYFDSLQRQECIANKITWRN